MGWLSGKTRPSRKKKAARRYYNNKEYKKAEPILLTLSKNKKDSLWALEVLSRLYLNTKEYQKSIDTLRNLIARTPEHELIKRLISVGCTIRNLEIAIEFSRYLEWGSNDEELLFELYKKFNTDMDFIYFVLNHSWPEEFFLSIFMKAKCLIEGGKIDQASSEIQSVPIGCMLSERTLVFAKDICKILENQSLSENLMINYLGGVGGLIERKKNLAKELLRSARFIESMKLVESVLRENPFDKEMLDLMIVVAPYAEQPNKALLAFRTLDRKGSVSISQVRNYAIAAVESSSSEEILHSTLRLIRLKVDANGAIRKAFFKLHELKDYESAEKIVKSLKKTPLKFDLKAGLALKEGREEEAISILNKGLALNPEHIPFLMRMGISLEAKGNLAEGIMQFERVLKINPTHESAANYRMQCGIKLWSEERYFQEISSYVKLYPDRLIHQLNRLNFVLSVRKDLDLALEIVNTCLAYYPDNQRTNMYHALVLSWQGRHEEARISVTKSISRWPDQNDVYITASQVEKNAGAPLGQITNLNSMLKLHGLEPVSSSSPDLAITPEYLNTESDRKIEDERLVSIIMTTYKQDPLLDAAIASILNQTYRNIELIIVDDCSPDENFEYLQKLADNDSRIRVFRMDINGGTYSAKNFGMTKSRGEFIGFMDSDDYCHAQRIEFQVASFDEHPDLMGITHDYFRIDESSNIEFRGIGALRMACISLLMRRQVLSEIGFFDSLRVGADTEYIERIEAKYGAERRLRARIPSMFMMLHSNSLTGGGPFHISWRSVNGHRLQHHRSFRSWHKKIKSGTEQGYLPQHIEIRPFEVPDAMKSES